MARYRCRWNRWRRCSIPTWSRWSPIGSSARCTSAARPFPGRVMAPSRRHRASAATSGARRHLGIYAYRVSALLRLAALPPSQLEQLEKLEQLRALEHGMDIRVAHAVVPPGPDVNTAARSGGGGGAAAEPDAEARIARLVLRVQAPLGGASAGGADDHTHVRRRLRCGAAAGVRSAPQGVRRARHRHCGAGRHRMAAVAGDRRSLIVSVDRGGARVAAAAVLGFGSGPCPPAAPFPPVRRGRRCAARAAIATADRHRHDAGADRRDVNARCADGRIRRPDAGAPRPCSCGIRRPIRHGCSSAARRHRGAVRHGARLDRGAVHRAAAAPRARSSRRSSSRRLRVAGDRVARPRAVGDPGAAAHVRVAPRHAVAPPTAARAIRVRGCG